MKNLVLVVFLTAFGISQAAAQNTLRPNLYYQNMHYYNAAAGIEDTSSRLSFSAYAKYKYVPANYDGYDDNVWVKPVNLYFNHIYNIDKKHAVNLSYIYDGYSFYNRNIIYLGYSRTFRWKKSNRLSIGGRTAVNFNAINWDKLGQITDPPSSRVRVNADLDAGIHYQYRGWTVGASVKNLFASSVKAEGLDLIKDQREFYGNFSYNFKLFKQRVELAPFFLFYKERNFNLDAGLNLGLYQKVSISYAIRVLELRNIFAIRGNLWNRFQVGASFDYSILLSDYNMDLLLAYRF